MLQVFSQARIGYYSGNPLLIFEDLALLKPHYFITVPRVLNKIYSKVYDSIAKKSCVVRNLFNKAVSTKRKLYFEKGILVHKFYDKKIFSKIKEMFGGNVKYCVIGSAPISADVLIFFKIALGVNIIEGYGQTESIGPATNTHPTERGAGHVGGVVRSIKLRLKDVPEMGYFVKDNCGELQFGGMSLFSGYYKNKEKTFEALEYDTEEDRKRGTNFWINSGDVVRIAPNGAVKIVDRAKNIFKLSQGEYIAPEKLENIYV